MVTVFGTQLGRFPPWSDLCMSKTLGCLLLDGHYTVSVTQLGKFLAWSDLCLLLCWEGLLPDDDYL
jgi:hypothetical protein